MKREDEKSGFFTANKQWILMGLGASAAVTAGAIFLSGGDNSELPNPPGRSAF